MNKNLVQAEPAALPGTPIIQAAKLNEVNAHVPSSTQRSTNFSRGKHVATRNPMPVDVLVGQNIRICRLQKGLSQGELGQQIGVTFQQVQKYEKGANRVGASRLNQIANVLGVSLPALFDGAPTASENGSDQSPRYLLSKPHSLRLLQGFEKIDNEGTRTALLQLVECLSQGAAHGGGGKSKGSHRK